MVEETTTRRAGRTRVDAAARWSAPSPGGRGEPLRVTLGDLVEAIASVTSDAAERAAVVGHVLRTCSR